MLNTEFVNIKCSSDIKKKKIKAVVINSKQKQKNMVFQYFFLSIASEILQKGMLAFIIDSSIA